MKHKKLLFLTLLMVLGAGKSISTYLFEEHQTRFVINEIQSANIDQFMDPSFNFGGWIELYNTDSQPLPLKGLYISDDSTRLKKSRLISEKEELEPKNFMIYWFGYNVDTPSQVNFNLDADGGTLYISNEQGDILTRQYYPKGISRTSYARTTDGGTSWAYTAAPTPGSSNNKTEYASQRLEMPDIDTESRLFSKPFEVHFRIPEGTQLRYTLDGTTPTLENGQVHAGGPLAVRNTTLLRCRLFQEGKLPSPVATRSYIYETRTFNVPILSVVTDSLYLYDDEIGIYVKGTNGKPNDGIPEPCNWNMDWNRPAHIDCFTTDGQLAVSQEALISICGEFSRTLNPKSLKIKARKKFDAPAYLPYSFFPSNPNLKYRTWQVRNGGNDNACRIKDCAIQEMILSSGLDVDGQRSHPVVHYLNGKYMGMLNVRDPNNAEYAYTHFGWGDDEIDHFAVGNDGYMQNRGTDSAMIRLHALSAQAASPFIYNQILDLLDVDEFINHMAVHLYIGSRGYGKNNIKAFRPRIEKGRFRFMLLDIDQAFTDADPFRKLRKKRYYNFHKTSSGIDKTEEIKFISIFFNLLQNETFRRQFVDTYCLIAGSVFENSRCEALLDSLVQQRALALSYENTSSEAMGHQLKLQMRGWQENQLANLKRKKYMHLEGVSSTRLKMNSNLSNSALYINNLPIPTQRFNGEIFLPITLQANTPAGYRFLGWRQNDALPHDTVFGRQSTWKYYDNGSLDQTPWKSSGAGTFWKEAAAPFGYGSQVPADIQTELNLKTDRHDYCRTYYFHKDFTLNDSPETVRDYLLTYTFNHGLVIYVNGKELRRDKMTSGDVSYESQWYYGWEKPRTFSWSIPHDMLHKGRNHISIELHKCRKSFPDVYFTAQLVAEKKEKKEQYTYLSTDETYCIDDTEGRETYDLTACFEPVTDKNRKPHETPVVVNEISASNSIYVNDLYKKKDWIELYNTTDQVIDLDGMYISNSEKAPHRYKIKRNNACVDTRIPPHGYKIIWADGNQPINELHADFKLDAEGGKVILSAADDSWSNSLKYGPHSDKHSVGRFPDGDAQLYVMNQPSIGRTNRINSYSAPVYPKDNLDQANEMHMVFEHNHLTITTPSCTPLTLTITNITGRRCLQKNLNGGKVLIPLNHLWPGTYTAKAVNAQGKENVIRFSITDE